MAKAKATPSAVQIAAAKARLALANAKEKNAKTPNDANAKAVAEATAANKIAAKAENEERFVTYGKIRVNKVVGAIKTFGECAKTKSFGYTPEQITKAFAAFDDALKAARARFDAGLSGKAETVTQTGFEF